MTTSKDLNDYNVDAKEYSKIDIKGKKTLFLSFRDIPGLIQKYLPADKPWKDCKCIDYGCGAGRSTRYLKSIGFSHVDGFDINQTTLKDAKKNDPSGHYSLIQNAKIPAANNTYDLALASFVFVEVGDKDMAEDIFKEIHRVLKPKGIFIIVTTSPELYNPGHPWLSYRILTEETQFKSGDVIPIKMTDIDLKLFDYFWTEKDYKEWAQGSHLKILETDHPKGKPSDDIGWASEAKVAPYTLYVLQK
jgi:ubiquinone/menaquinone biosynthesis C-methylase UbiE